MWRLKQVADVGQPRDGRSHGGTDVSRLVETLFSDDARLVTPDVALETELLTLVSRVTVEATEVLTFPRAR